MYLFLRWKTYALLLATGTLLWGSCAIGYDSPNGFDVGVSDTQMETPTQVTFAVSVDGTTARIGWPLVVGAKGYEVSFYNVDDPENPVVVDGYEKKLVDGCYMTVPVAEDCKYKLELRALGNEAYGNTDDDAPIIYDLSTLVPSVATIPSGADIYTYLQEHPLPPARAEEVAIDLEAGGSYTCSGPVEFGGQRMTFRSDKLNRAIVNMTGKGAFYSFTGLKIKYINFDCAESTAGSFIYMSKGTDVNDKGDPILPDSIKSQNLGYMRDGSPIKDIYIVEEPVYISNCWIKDLPKSMIHDNEVNCAWWYFTITNCIIQQKNKGSDPFINLQKKAKCIKHIDINNSTIYNTEDSGGYWLRYNNSSNANVQKVFGNTTSEHSTGSVDFYRCTFCKTYSKQKMANNNNATGMSTTMTHCIFYDIKQIRTLSEIGIKKYGFNIYWAYTSPDTNDPTRKDNSGTPFASVYDPKFAGNIAQSLNLTQPNAGVNFTPQEREVVVNGAGDPRWLPVY